MASNRSGGLIDVIGSTRGRCTNVSLDRFGSMVADILHVVVLTKLQTYASRRRCLQLIYGMDANFDTKVKRIQLA